ncbi:MAG: hypothetical protein WAT12_01795 [Candidatus Nitrotoga sp.]
MKTELDPIPEAKHLELMRVVEIICDKAACAFHLAAEALFIGMFFVFTRYKPNIHDLRELKKCLITVETQCLCIFSLANDVEKCRFELLRKAYACARYSKEFSISMEYIACLAERVRELKKWGRSCVR